jgi:membrane protease subunit HflC
MKEHKWTVVLVVVVVVLLLVYSAGFTVDYRQTAFVTTFGKAGPPIDGATQQQGLLGGLHWKWPWPIQHLVRYDRRTMVLEDAHEQISTSDKQNVIVTLYCGWRIGDPQKFFLLETVAKAEERLRGILRHEKGNVFGRHAMTELVNTDPDQMRIDQIEREIRAAIEPEAAKDGIETVSLGIMSMEVPQGVSQRVINSMKEERKSYADAYRTGGQAEASRITSWAQTASKQIMAFANGKAESIKAEGKKDAAAQYVKFRQDEQFAMFLRELEFWREALKKNTVIILDPSVARSIGFLMQSPTLSPLDVMTPATQPARPDGPEKASR